MARDVCHNSVGWAALTRRLGCANSSAGLRYHVSTTNLHLSPADDTRQVCHNSVGWAAISYYVHVLLLAHGRSTSKLCQMFLDWAILTCCTRRLGYPSMFHLSFDISAQPTRSASTVSNIPSEVRSPLTIWELKGMGSGDACARYIRGSKLQMDSRLLFAARSIASASARHSNYGGA